MIDASPSQPIQLQQAFLVVHPIIRYSETSTLDFDIR